MADLARIKRNVRKMAAQNAPEEDIDGYIASEGVTIEDVRNFTALDPAADAVEQSVRGFNRGLNAVVSFPGEVVGGAVDLMGGDGDRFRFDNPLSQFLSSPDRQPQTTTGRFADAAGQAVGVTALPYAGIAARAPAWAAQAPQTTFQAVRQAIAAPIAQSPRAAAALEGTSAATSGMATQLAREEGYGPTTQMVAGMVGGMAPGAAVAGGMSTVNAMRRAAARQGQTGAYAKMAESLPDGTDTLRRQISTGAEAAGRGGAAAQRDIALRILGEEMERAGGNVAVARAAAIPRIQQEVSQTLRTNITHQTASRYLTDLERMHQRSPLMLGEQPAVAAADDALRGPAGGLRQPNNVNADALARIQETETQPIFDYLATSGNERAAVRTRDALGRRQETLSPAMRGTLESIGPQHQGPAGAMRPATIVDADDMINQARQAGSAAYRAAYNSPIDNRIMLTTLPRILDRAQTNANLRAADKREAIMRALNQFYIDGPNGPVAMMTLQQLQDARGTVRRQISSYVREGRDDLVQAVQPLYNQITRLMTAMSPQWAQANRQWADMSFDVLGRELGDAFTKRAGPRFRQQLEEFRGLNPQAQNIVRIHFLQKLYDDLDNLGDTHSVSKLFTNDHTRRAIQELFGADARNQFIRMVRDIRTAERSFQMNSRTHIRGEVAREMRRDQDATAAADLLSVAGLRRWLLDKATSLAVGARDRPLADIVTTPMSDVPRVAQHLERMRRAQQRMQQFAQPALVSRGAIGTAGGLTTVEE